MLRNCYLYVIALVLLGAVPLTAAPAQIPDGADCTKPSGGSPNRPHPVCEVKAVITHGPYLSAPTDTSATIVWMTDLPSSSKVIYGSAGMLDREAAPEKDGMRPVGKLHSVRITGLEPGHTYSYRVISTPVLELSAYWPTTGMETRSETYSFTTLDPRKASVSFVSITDTHEGLARIDSLMRKIDWDSTDFLVHTGDCHNWVASEEQLWEKCLDPLITGGMGHSTPLIFARGNHDTRGAYARSLAKDIPIEGGHFYYTRDAGPLHLLIIDTGEDKHDTTQVYADLNRMAEYREQELAWFHNEIRTSERLRTAPFRMLLMHQPRWGWLGGDDRDAARARWTEAANEAKVDLIIAGHTHRFSFTPAGGPPGNEYPILVVGQGDLARVQATENEIHVTVIAQDGTIRKEFSLTRRK